MTRFISRRFNNPRQVPRSIRIMRMVAGVGVAIAVAALVISASVGAGFEREYRNALLDFNAHVIVMGGMGIPDASFAMEKLSQFQGASEAELVEARRYGWLRSSAAWIDSRLQGLGLDMNIEESLLPKFVTEKIAMVRGIEEREVVSMTPFLYREGMLIGPGIIRGVVVKGIDAKDRASVGGMRIELADKGADIESALRPRDGTTPVLLGSALAATMSQGVQRLKLVIPSKEGQRSVDLAAVGTFESGMHDYDADFILMDIGAARRAFGAGEREASGVELRLADPDDAEVVAAAVEERLGPAFNATTWGELNYDLLAAVRLERLVSAIIMGIMLVVAALNIIAVLVLTTINRLPEIAMLKALGLRDRDIRSVLVRGGTGVGIKGVAAGLALGLSAAFLTKKLGLIPLDAEIYMIGTLPIDISWSICGIVALFCVSVLWLASKFAAKRLARIEPAEGLARAR